MTQASKELGGLGVLGLCRGTPISYEFPLAQVVFEIIAKKGFYPLFGCGGYLNMGILGLDLFILVLGIFENFMGI